MARYAKAKRFERSILLNETGHFGALHYGPSCIQSPAAAYEQKNQTLSEHCLFLNVWAPRAHVQNLLEGKSVSSLPIVVYIHGGAFALGSGAPTMLRPGQYTKHDVILVTINYRLNLLGFLAFPNLPYTNFGLLDQQVALEWIQANIEAFGGDASKVTLIGDSAGAISILHQLTTPSQLDKPLFHRGILVSLGLFAGPEYALNVSQKLHMKLAARLGCPGPLDVSLQCLRQLPATATRIPMTRLPSPFTVLIPAEHRFTGIPHNDGHFYPDLIESLSQGKFDKRVPLIIGSDLDEGSLFTFAAFPIVYPTEEYYHDIVRELFPKDAELIYARYSPERLGSVKKAVNELSSHLFTSQGSCQAARMISKHSPSPVYRYGNYHVFQHHVNEQMGVYHTAAHALFMQTNVARHLMNPEKWSDAEVAMSDRFGSLLMQFVHGKEFSEEEWPRFDQDHLRELAIGPNNTNQLIVSSGFQAEDCDFWAKLYPPHGLFPPMYHGDIYAKEPRRAFFLNSAFWVIFVNIWLVMKIIGVTFVGMALLLYFCYCSPFRRGQKVTTAVGKKVKKD